MADEKRVGTGHIKSVKPVRVVPIPFDLGYLTLCRHDAAYSTSCVPASDDSFGTQ